MGDCSESRWDDHVCTVVIIHTTRFFFLCDIQLISFLLLIVFVHLIFFNYYCIIACYLKQNVFNKEMNVLLQSMCIPYVNQ